MQRSTHPIIQAINRRDRELRDSGKAHGLWSVDEAAGILSAGRMTIYRLVDSNALECTNMGTQKNARYLRITSASLVAFVITNTTGPDESALCNNLEKLIRTLSADALTHLADYIAARKHLLSNGTTPAPRKIRRLSDALNPDLNTQPPEKTPDLFTDLVTSTQAPTS
jgi:excisionase family DNA binding protein